MKPNIWIGKSGIEPESSLTQTERHAFRLFPVHLVLCYSLSFLQDRVISSSPSLDFCHFCSTKTAKTESGWERKDQGENVFVIIFL
jgi:hypothetical protein